MRSLIGLSVLAASLLAGPAALALSGHGAGIATGGHRAHRGRAAVPLPLFPLGLSADSAEAGPVAPPVAVVVQPAPAAQIVDRPPCRETTPEGVVVQRGGGCSHSAP